MVEVAAKSSTPNILVTFRLKSHLKNILDPQVQFLSKICEGGTISTKIVILKG